MLGLLSTRLGGLAVAVLVGLAVGGGLGYRLAAGAHAHELQAQAIEYAEGWQRAVAAARRDAEAESARAAAAATARAQSAAAAREVIHAAANDPDARDCEWRDAQRVRIESLYRAYGYPVETDPARVPDSMPDAAESRDGS